MPVALLAVMVIGGVYLLYVIYCAYDFPDAVNINPDTGLTQFTDAFGTKSYPRFMQWLKAGMPDLGSATAAYFSDGKWPWLLIMLLAYLLFNKK